MGGLGRVIATRMSMVLTKAIAMGTSTTRSVRAPCEDPALSDFPSGTSLRSLRVTSSGRSLEVVSSPSQNTGCGAYTTRTMTLLRVCSAAKSNSSSDFAGLNRS